MKTHLEQAIRDAVEKGGYKNIPESGLTFNLDTEHEDYPRAIWYSQEYPGEGSVIITTQEILLDPLFWQALGKARGWNSPSFKKHTTCASRPKGRRLVRGNQIGMEHYQVRKACGTCGKEIIADIRFIGSPHQFVIALTHLECATRIMGKDEIEYLNYDGSPALKNDF